VGRQLSTPARSVLMQRTMPQTVSLHSGQLAAANPGREIASAARARSAQRLVSSNPLLHIAASNYVAGLSPIAVALDLKHTPLIHDAEVKL
jgi:hypothetical protein